MTPLILLTSDSGKTVIYHSQGEVKESAFVKRVNPV